MSKDIYTLPIEGTSAYDVYSTSFQSESMKVIPFPGKSFAQSLQDDCSSHPAQPSIMASFKRFMVDGRMYHGLRYENVSGKAFNRMTRSQALGTSLLFMSIALATVFFGI